MKKTILIILGIIALLVIGIWVYLMLFGTPTSVDDVFADLGFGTSEPPAFEPVPEQPEPVVTEPEPEPVDDTNPLQQITERPVAGSIILGTSTASSSILYVEQGTGHIYEYNLETNTEKRISGVTYAQVNEAHFSPYNSYVVMKINDSVAPKTFIVDYTDTTLNLTLSPDAENIAFSSDGTAIYYTRHDSNGTLGYTYSIANQTNTVLFSVPFTAISVDWNTSSPYIYNKPSETYPGYLYKVENNTLQPVTSGGRGLVAEVFNDTPVVSQYGTGGYMGYKIDTTGNSTQLPLTVLPEKCVAATDTTDAVWCTYPIEKPTGHMPNDWYKGVISLDDSLWRIDLSNNVAAFFDYLKTPTDTYLDINNISIDTTGSKLLLTDKTTNTLWLYDITKH